VDQIFEQRQQCGQAIKEMEAEIARGRTDAEDKINALAPHQLELYKNLLVTNQQVTERRAEGEGQLSQVRSS
jgi:hypothetical protein